MDVADRWSKLRRSRLALLISFTLSLTVVASAGAQPAVIYDNDAVIDTYADDYIMALASAGHIRLLGMITSSPIAPFNPYTTSDSFEATLVARQQGVVHARNSGFSHIPDAIRGTKGHLVRPASGRVEDTVPLGSPGTSVIVEHARREPLVLVMGGPLTVAADAYLADPSIAHRLTIAYIGGTSDSLTDYNTLIDPWAAYIVMEKMQMVVFPAHPRVDPIVPKASLWQLPASPLRQWMIGKWLPEAKLPDERDIDAPPAIWLMRRDYITQIRRVSFSHWLNVPSWGRAVPAFREDPAGRTVVATGRSQHIATAEWWRALSNPAAYTGPASTPPASPPSAPPTGILSFRASDDYAGGQGHRNWFYRDTNGQMASFHDGIWKGTEDYLWLWRSGGNPGATRDAVRRFVVPVSGMATISATIIELNTTCGDGVTVSLRQGGVTLWHRDRPKRSPTESLLITLAVNAGDPLDFVIGRRGTNACDGTDFNPRITLTPSAG
jgi:hypothetical protein